MFLWRLSVLFFCLLLLVSGTAGWSAEVDRGLDRRWPIITSGEAVWIGTDGGLNRYDLSEDTWQVYTPREGLCHWQPELLGLDRDILWVGTPKGFCNADVRLFDWDVFDTTRGLPGNRVLAFAFEEDYIWVGTDGGVVRYDPLIEELERFTGPGTPAGRRVNDIAVAEEAVWLATEDGIWEFDREYETWRTHGTDQGLLSPRAGRIIAGAGALWFVTDAGLERFEPESRTWHAYRLPEMPAIHDAALDGTTIWLATDGGVYFYDLTLDQWRELQELRGLPFRSVNGLVVAQDEIWMTSRAGVARFHRGSRTWTFYTEENGLSTDDVKTIAYANRILFVTSPGAVDYYKLDEDRWYSRPVSVPEEGAGAAPGRAVFSLGGPDGTAFRPTEEIDMRLLGRASYQLKRTDIDRSGQGQWESEQETRGRTDLVLASTLGQGRSANLFYDDTQFREDPEYGARYRGGDNDLLGELSLGDLRWDLGRGELLPTLGLFGGGARIEYGERTEQLRRRRISLAVAGGDQTTDFQTDTFIGASRDHSGSVSDHDYLARRFFVLTEDEIDLPIEAGSVTVYLDDALGSTNTPNTKENFTVAGMTGDFDLLQQVDEYILDEHQGVLDLLAAVPSTAVLAASFRAQDHPEERREVLLFAANSDRSLVNRYSLGAREILPHTLALDIVKPDGTPVPLEIFGLDEDRDGAVDARWVNFHDGILRFPDGRPFPDSVYVREDSGHAYDIVYRHQTSSTALQLSRGDLISESEQVVVDGRSLHSGEDYIVDYRSGSVLFLKEGLVDQGSRVEVAYEYRRESEDRLASAGLSFSPSDVLTTSVNMVHYQPQEDDSLLGSAQLWQAGGELRFNEGPGGMDVMVFSEVAGSVREDDQASAATAEVSARRDGLRLLARVEEYEENFLSLRPRQHALGRSIRKVHTEARYERANLFVLEGNWSRERFLAADGRRADEERSQARAILNRTGLPAVVISLDRRQEGGAAPFPDETALKVDMEYQLPGRWLEPLPVRSVKITSYLHRTWEQGVDSTYLPISPKAVRQGDYLRLDVSPAADVQTAVSLRRERRQIQPESTGDGYQPFEETGELIFTASCDRLPGLSLYTRLEGDARRDVISGKTPGSIYDLDRQRQVTTRIYPGRWQSLLDLLTLELDYFYRWNGYLSGVREALSFRQRYWSAFDDRSVTAADRFESGEARMEIRPSSSLQLSFGLERQDTDQARSNSLHRQRLWTLDGKVEYRWAGSVYVVNFVHDRLNIRGLSTQTRAAPSLWWERRWNRGLISKLSLFLWRERLREGAQRTTFSSLSPRLSLTARRDRLSIFGAVELTDDLSWTLSESETWQATSSSRVIANALKLDLRPLPLALFRLQSQVSHTDREGGTDTLRHDLTLKLTLQF